MVCEHLQEFFEVFLRPIVDASDAVSQRVSMRASSKLNELLFDNLKGLEALYEEGKKGEYFFTQDSAVQCFMRYPICAKVLNTEKIQ